MKMLNLRKTTQEAQYYVTQPGWELWLRWKAFEDGGLGEFLREGLELRVEDHTAAYWNGYRLDFVIEEGGYVSEEVLRGLMDEEEWDELLHQGYLTTDPGQQGHPDYEPLIEGED